MTLATGSAAGSRQGSVPASLVARGLGLVGRPVVTDSEQPQRHLSAWTLVLSWAGLPLAAYAANASRTGDVWAVDLFYLGIAVVFLFPAYAILKPGSTRLERVEALAALTLALYGIRLLREPIAFIDHDEFLHWTTANHILTTGRLFAPNALLPISPLYPGLEIVTTAFVWLTGLSVFQAAQFVLLTARCVFVASLFYAYEQLSGSSRIAACACLIYMGCSTFLVFDTQFSYESMAVSLVAASILADARSRRSGRLRNVIFVLVPLIAGLAITHHMTAYFAAIFLIGLAALDLLKAASHRYLLSSILVAAWSLAAPLAWSRLMGNPGVGYLGPVLESGFNEATSLLSFSGTGRTLFASTDGYVAPVSQRVLALGSVAFVCLGLAIGFFRSFALGGLRFDLGLAAVFRRPSVRLQSGIILFILLTLAFPLSLLLRLTQSGWEIGNRIGPFSFIGVAFVVAVAVVAFLSNGPGRKVQTAMMAAAALVILEGGIISAEGPRLLVPAHFKVSSDSSSFGPMAIDAARWSRAMLGERNLFYADRINRLLLSTYGGQDVASTLLDGLDASDAVLAPRLGPAEKTLLKAVRLDYLAVDMRITTDLPGVGVYFDGGPRDHGHVVPPSPASLLKFNTEPKVGKVFDNGSIFIYDLRWLDGTL